MKKNLLFQIIGLMLVASSLINCSGDGGTPTLNITSIKLSVDQSTLLLGQTVTFTATNQDDIDITNEVIFKVNNAGIDGNTYTPDAIGNIGVVAIYEIITSNSLSVNVIENITEITISVDQPSIKPLTSSVAQFSAKNQENEDITSVVRFYQDGEPMREGVSSFSTEEFGTYNFTAQYEQVTSNAVSVVSELNVTSLTLTSDKAIIPANGNTSPKLYVVDQDNDTITHFVSIFYDDAELVGGIFNTTTIGSFDLTAKYENVESNVLNITSVAQRTNKKVLIEEFTGEWCGWCPQAAYNLDLLVRNNSKVLTVGIHNGDNLSWSNEALIRNSFGLNYFPSGLVGRVNLGQAVGYNGVTLDTRVTDEVDRQLNQEEVLAGLSINTSISGDNALVDVSVEFYNTAQEQLGVTIYLIENDVISGAQTNYFSNNENYQGTYYYDQPASISEYVHQYVLRKAATDARGDDVPSSEVAIDNIYSLPQKTIDITDYDASKCYIIAFIHYQLDGDRQNIINAQQVLLGSNIGFEE